MNRQVMFSVFALAASGLGSAHAQTSKLTSSDDRHGQPSGVLFTSTNEAEGNRVLAFVTAPDGSLNAPTAFATQGVGSGDSLASQGALTLSEDHRVLLVVNAGSNDITSFKVDGASLSFADRVSSGGTRPVSVTEKRGLVYVVNAGGTNNIAGFFLDARGKLHAVNGGTAPLSAASTGAAQIALTADARSLVVSEKTTNKLDVFDVSAFGRLAVSSVVVSAGMTPYGFQFTQRGDLIVSEAASGSLSSYSVSRRDGLDVISAAVSDTQAAPCWVAISADDHYAFTSNAGSASISSYEIARSGQIQLKQARAGALATGGTPLDLVVGHAGHLLYVLDRGNTQLTSFEINADGSLASKASVGALPAFSSGLTAY
jgi:6-phosphogluconolactonase